ncbi:MAG TPA: hypothetical protein VG407_11040 [Caulobacteraceae bacterium]|jgi:hypothetical protein|nr:hypothetical protein [Caulobacteraceae bacterium]
MDIHKPQPFHNWREFTAEIAVIVIGVLIALSAEQVVQAFEWNHKVDRAERAMRTEIAADDGPQVYERLALADCIDASLARVRADVEKGASRADVLAAVAQYSVPHHSWDSQDYDAAREEGVTLHGLHHDTGWWGLTYAEMPVLDRGAEREFQNGAALGAISHTGGALSDEEKGRILLAVETLTRDNRAMADAARIAAFGMHQLHLGIDPQAMAREINILRGTPGASGCIAKFKALASLHEPVVTDVPPPVR